MTLSRDDLRKWVLDGNRRSLTTWARDLTRWIKRATRRATLVASSTTASLDDDTIDIFWISVYGIAVDLKERLHEMDSTGFAQSIGLSPADLGQDSGLSACLANLQTLRDALTDDEWLYIARARNVAAHPHLSAYGIAIRGDKLIADRKRPILDRAVAVDQEDEALDRVLAEHGGTDGAVAVHIASKISTAMRAVEESFGVWWVCEDAART